MSASSHVQTIVETAYARGNREMWVDPSVTISWEGFARAVEDAGARYRCAGVSPSDPVVATPGAGSLDSLAWMFGCALAGGIAAPLRPERKEELQSWKRFLRVGWRVEARQLVRDGGGSDSPAAARLLEELFVRGHAGLILATGGTAGVAKVVLHDLTNLLSTIPIGERDRPKRILPLMRFDHIGGLDTAWRAIAAGHTLVAPPAELTPERVAATVEEQRVEVLPATPSFLNLLLVSGASASRDFSSLRVVPYGAEPMPPTLLERLRRAFPRVLFVERFGTSETGALPVNASASGLALSGSQADFSWKVVDGELWIKSRTRALGYLSGQTMESDEGGWLRTGDVAEQGADGSIRVLGRRSALINVGGEKVLPSVVESALLTHPLVADCQASAHPNALLGQVVRVDLVWKGPETDAISVKRKLHDFTASLLPKSHLPAVVRLVGAIDTTPNLKKPQRACLESN